jgi:hypothetical protein
MMPNVAPVVAPVMPVLASDEQSKANALTLILTQINGLVAHMAHLDQKIDHIWTAIGQPQGMSQVEAGSLIHQLQNMPNEFKNVRADIIDLRVDIEAVRMYMQTAGTGAYDALNTSQVQDLSYRLQEKVLGKEFMERHRR